MELLWRSVSVNSISLSHNLLCEHSEADPGGVNGDISLFSVSVGRIF